MLTEEKLKKKVFCSECKYFRPEQRFEFGILRDAECRAEWKWRWDYEFYWKEYANPSEKNKNNDCPDFEPKCRFIYRIVGWINKVIYKLT